MATDGGANAADRFTAVYADQEVAPTIKPLRCTDDPEGNPCQAIDGLSSLKVSSEDLISAQRNLEDAFERSITLLAVENSDCNGDEEVGVFPFEMTELPFLDSAGQFLNITYQMGQLEELDLPVGYNASVHPDCAVIGNFRVIQYRVSISDDAAPALERRDYSQSEPWSPVAANVENLQVQLFYASQAPLTPQPLLGGGSGGGGNVGSVSVTIGGGSWAGTGDGHPWPD